LFVARVFANDADDAVPADDPAGFAELFDGRAYFHGETKREEGSVLSV
jgi:hypothetical protein